MATPEILPAYWKEKKPNYWRRALWHDYSSPCIYMITLVKGIGIPDFSTLCAREIPKLKVWTNLSETGEIIKKTLLALPEQFPWLEIYDFAIMPDHVHFIIHIKEPGHKLGETVHDIKKECTKAWRARLRLEIGTAPSLFIPNYHDRILTGRDQLPVMKRYVRDNPRRLWVKLHHPEYFRNRYSFKINGKRYVGIGNFYLLDHPDKMAVIVSSKRTAEENGRLRKQWLRCAESGGVLIGGYISPKEKEVRDEGIELGANVILIQGNGFPERFKPSGPYFEAFSEGRVLIIGEEEYHTEKIAHLRAKALEMNELAVYLATTQEELLKR